MLSTRRPRSILASGVAGSGLVGGLLGDQRILEHLQGIRHGADFGLLAAARHLADKGPRFPSACIGFTTEAITGRRPAGTRIRSDAARQMHDSSDDAQHEPE